MNSKKKPTHTHVQKMHSHKFIYSHHTHTQLKNTIKKFSFFSSERKSYKNFPIKFIAIILVSFGKHIFFAYES